MTAREHGPEWSIVVPTYNQSALLLRLLKSLEALEERHRLEVIIVDDCSPDDTETVARAWCEGALPFPAKYLRLDKNSGPGRARNEGARAASGHTILYTDSDCVVAPGWARSLAGGIDLARGIVAVAGKVEALSLDSAAARYYHHNKILQPPANFVLYLVTCNAAFDRQALLEVGGFSEDIPHPGGEDIEASILLWKAGWRFVFVENALIYHDFRASLRNLYKTFYNYGQGSGFVMHRQLAPQEIIPELGHRRIKNFWDGRFTRPAVTGVRSFFSTWAYLHRLYREDKLPWGEILRFHGIWLLQTSGHYRGWKKGVARYFERGERSPAYFKQADPSRESPEITEDPFASLAHLTFSGR